MPKETLPCPLRNLPTIFQGTSVVFLVLVVNEHLHVTKQLHELRTWAKCT